MSAMSAVQSKTLLVTTPSPATVASCPKMPANGLTNGVLYSYIQSTKPLEGFAPSSRKANLRPIKASINPPIVYTKPPMNIYILLIFQV
jgi:hypothetical protein